MHTSSHPIHAKFIKTGRLLSAALFICLLLAACSGRAAPTQPMPVTSTAVPMPAVSPTAAEPTAETAPTEIVLPTAVTAAAAAPTATTAAPAATATSGAVADPALEQVKLVGLSWLEKYKYNLLLSFDFPGPVDPADYRVTLEDKEYLCEVLGQFPNRLYCNGQGAKVLAYAQVKIYPAGSSLAGFEQDVWVPYFE